MLAMPYSAAPDPAKPPAVAEEVSRYAWGDGDYHDVIRERLHQLADYLRELSPDA